MRRSGILAGIIVAGLFTSPVVAGGESTLQNAFLRADGPEERVKVVREIGQLDSRRAAAMLKKIASEDPSAFVRESAVDGLGTCGSDKALEHLLELMAEGGSEVFREAVARAVVRKEGGLESILEGARNEEVQSHRRSVAIAALGIFEDAVTLHALYSLAQSDSYITRTDALHALGRRTDAAEDLPAALAEVYRNRLDPATRLLILDLIEARPDPEFLPTLKAGVRPRHPRVKEALRHAIAAVEHEKMMIRKRAAEEDGYGAPEPPGRPEPRPRYDLVFAFDATGSMSGITGSVRRTILRRVKALGAETADIRVGIVAFRQVQKGVSWKYPSVIPLTHDIDKVTEFLTEYDHGFPADSQGAAIYHGLHLGLNRMVYRADATKEFMLFCDSKCHNYAKCHRAVVRHMDDVRIRFVWCGRRVHPDIRKLAALTEAPLIR